MIAHRMIATVNQGKLRPVPLVGNGWRPRRAAEARDDGLGASGIGGINNDPIVCSVKGDARVAPG